MSVEFVASASAAAQFPRDRLPEIAFVGRSNVGKSSLLNALLLGVKPRAGSAPVDRKQLAHVSRTPGRTRTLNFYKVDRAFYFVDLPGYGYAKVSRKSIHQWRGLAESYLLHRPELRLVVVIVDSRHGGTPLDLQMIDWLRAKEIPHLVVATKADKLRSGERHKALKLIQENFRDVLPFSAKNGEGVALLWNHIRRALTNQTLTS